MVITWYTRGLGLLVLCLMAGCSAPARMEFSPTTSTRFAPAEWKAAGSSIQLVEGTDEIPSAAVTTLASTIQPLLSSIDSTAPIEQGNWTLDDLLKTAFGNHPSLARAVARVESLKGKWVQSGLPPNPTIGYVGDEMGAEGTAGLQGAYVSQRIVTANKLGLNQQIVEHEIDRAEQQMEALRRRIQTDVRLGYYDTLVAQRKVALAQKLIEVSDQAVNASKDLLAVREIPRIGLLQSEVEAQNARIVLRKAENELTASWQILTTVIGLPAQGRTNLTGDIDAESLDLDYQQQLARLMSTSPEVANAVAQLGQAHAKVGRARVEPIPDINIQMTLQHDNTIGDEVAGIQVGIAVPLWNKNQGAIYRAEQEVVVADRNIQRVRLELQQRLATIFQQYRDARFQVQTFSDHILPKAQETFDLVTSGYQAGEIGYLDMLTAQRTYFRTNLSSIGALHDLLRAASLIDGLTLDDSLSTNDAL